jgi:hypothetical protein
MRRSEDDAEYWRELKRFADWLEASQKARQVDYRNIVYGNIPIVPSKASERRRNEAEAKLAVAALIGSMRLTWKRGEKW